LANAPGYQRRTANSGRFWQETPDMHISIVTSWFRDVAGGSGTGVFFNSFVSGLRDRGFDVELLAPVLHGKDYIDVTLQRFLFNTQLRNDPRVQNTDILIGFDYDGYGIDPLQRPPMIASAHAVFGDVIAWEREPIRTMVESQAFFDRVAMQQADRVTCGSAYARERIVDLYGVPGDKVQVIPHGMVMPNWLRLAQRMKPVPNDHPVILSVGKMYPRKRLDILLRAMPALIAQHPTIELRVVGDGLEWEAMRALSYELDIDDHVTWLGHVGDDERFAREWVNADVFCHPSLQETFGFVYLEAMKLGKAIVASHAGAAPEVIGDAGILIEREDSNALAVALDRLVVDADLRRQLGEVAQSRAALYSQRRMIDGYVQLMDELIGERPRSYSNGHHYAGALRKNGNGRG
jgi:glycosyltransferase involved in cell wall biosynthesis